MPETLLYEVVEVTQADRDAAEQFFLKGGIGFRRLERAFARHRLAALASLQPSVSEMRGWQPIESAPKDGTPVLLYGPYEDVSVAEWRDNAWACLADGRHAIEHQSDFGTEYIYFTCPTHWMPLPEPPAQP